VQGHRSRELLNQRNASEEHVGLVLHHQNLGEPGRKRVDGPIEAGAGDLQQQRGPVGGFDAVAQKDGHIEHQSAQGQDPGR